MDFFFFNFNPLTSSVFTSVWETEQLCVDTFMYLSLNDTIPTKMPFFLSSLNVNVVVAIVTIYTWCIYL